MCVCVLTLMSLIYVNMLDSWQVTVVTLNTKTKTTTQKYNMIKTLIICILWEVVGGKEIFSTAHKCLLHSNTSRLKVNNKSHGHLVYETLPLIIGRVRFMT